MLRPLASSSGRRKPLHHLSFSPFWPTPSSHCGLRTLVAT
ncbi:hypothetical protein ACMD2_09952 [Ananas comosus]|uniref:Uncharacterized protein n=1 Tax=Ananas comosus TaxID=4615 RepID=A0A199WA93_ANACO|nr:hypothetical protein ACMD2_09952 [Ananas comosus]